MGFTDRCGERDRLVFSVARPRPAARKADRRDRPVVAGLSRSAADVTRPSRHRDPELAALKRPSDLYRGPERKLNMARELWQARRARAEASFGVRPRSKEGAPDEPCHPPRSARRRRRAGGRWQRARRRCARVPVGRATRRCAARQAPVVARTHRPPDRTYRAARHAPECGYCARLRPCARCREGRRRCVSVQPHAPWGV